VHVDAPQARNGQNGGFQDLPIGCDDRNIRLPVTQNLQCVSRIDARRGEDLDIRFRDALLHRASRKVQPSTLGPVGLGDDSHDVEIGFGP